MPGRRPGRAARLRELPGGAQLQPQAVCCLCVLASSLPVSGFMAGLSWRPCQAPEEASVPGDASGLSQDSQPRQVGPCSVVKS